jgi:hypothetical protein
VASKVASPRRGRTFKTEKEGRADSWAQVPQK